jgi:hypothetical protein
MRNVESIIQTKLGPWDGPRSGGSSLQGNGALLRAI